MNIKIFSLSFFFILILLSSCSDDKEKIPPFVSDRTVLIYMAADNSLNNESFENMDAILKNSLDNLNNGRLLIYYDRSSSAPKLIEVVQNKNRIETKIIKTYDEHNSASGEVLSGVINDAFSMYKSKSKGIVLWSHGTSWLPADRSLLSTRSFGQDGKEEMDIDELKKALPDFFFDFIIFDACLMSSVEVCYELKDKAKYIVGSANEIYAKGFPYDLIIHDLFSDDLLENQLKSISDLFYDYYLTQTEYSEYDHVAAISVIKTAGMNDLAMLCRKIIEDETNILDMNVDDIQPIYYLYGKTKILYDFKDFYDRIANISERVELEKLLEKIIVYEKHSNEIFVSYLGLIPIDRYCGLSSYIPRQRSTKLNEWYYNLDWGKAVFQETE